MAPPISSNGQTASGSGLLRIIKGFDIQVWRCSGFLYSFLEIFRYSDVQVFRCLGFQKFFSVKYSFFQISSKCVWQTCSSVSKWERNCKNMQEHFCSSYIYFTFLVYKKVWLATRTNFQLLRLLRQKRLIMLFWLVLGLFWYSRLTLVTLNSNLDKAFKNLNKLKSNIKILKIEISNKVKDSKF